MLLLYQNISLIEFFRIIDWMPYIVELNFIGDKLLEIKEHINDFNKNREVHRENEQDI